MYTCPQALLASEGRPVIFSFSDLQKKGCLQGLVGGFLAHPARSASSKKHAKVFIPRGQVLIVLAISACWTGRGFGLAASCMQLWKRCVFHHRFLRTPKSGLFCVFLMTTPALHCIHPTSSCGTKPWKSLVCHL